MSDNEIPEKIMRTLTALLNRAKHPNTPEPEAKLCAEQAERLMLKHSISEAKASATQKQKSKIGVWEIQIFGSYQQHRAQLLIDVAVVFSCRVIVITSAYNQNRKYELIGREGDLAMVFTLFDHLLTQLDVNILGFTGRDQRFKKSFILKFSSIVSDRLKELYDDEIANDSDSVGTAVVLANIGKEVDLYISDEYGKLGKGRALSYDSYEGMIHGKDAASKADIFLPGARFESEERRDKELTR